MRLGGQDRSAGSGMLRQSLRSLLSVKLSFDFGVRHRKNTSREFGKAVKIACLILGGRCRVISHNSTFLSLERRVGVCVLKVNYGLTGLAGRVGGFCLSMEGQCFASTNLVFTT
jgi:hypothetical protein